MNVSTSSGFSFLVLKRVPSLLFLFFWWVFFFPVLSYFVFLTKEIRQIFGTLCVRERGGMWSLQTVAGILLCSPQICG